MVRNILLHMQNGLGIEAESSRFPFRAKRACNHATNYADTSHDLVLISGPFLHHQQRRQ